MSFWRNRWKVLLAIGGLCLLMALGGAAAAFHNRHHTICSDRKPPVAQLGGILGDVEYRCHNGQVVTLND